jgi:phosphatidate phosphatase PAH1
LLTGYCVCSSYAKKPRSEKANSPSKPRNSFTSEKEESIKSVEPKIATLSKTIKKEYDREHKILSLKTVYEILEQAPLLVEQKFIDKTLQNRRGSENNFRYCKKEENS